MSLPVHGTWGGTNHRNEMDKVCQIVHTGDSLGAVYCCNYVYEIKQEKKKTYKYGTHRVSDWYANSTVHCCCDREKDGNRGVGFNQEYGKEAVSAGMWFILTVYTS